ncbi:MAG: hypothetical protein JXB00_18465 [Bacteroidales bacterium]|nr:hypothetical protein [Bacteroidales bacterium]
MESKRFHILRHTALIIMLAFLLITCEDDNTLIQNNELIFKHASAIDVPVYTYLSGPDEIIVHGDSGPVDTLTPMPVLRWDSVNVPYIVAAIFSQPIEIEGGVISNTSDIVWIWHSGLETGKDGYVEFTEGKQMINGDIQNLTAPASLTGPANYYWGVWGWNYPGTRILFSSRPLAFYIK